MSWVLLQTTCHPCVSGCGRCLALSDGRDHCLTCLGSKHAEGAFVDESSSHCGCSSRSCGQAPLPRQRGGALLLPSRSSSRLRIRVVENPQGTIAPLALRNQLSCQWNVLGPLHGVYQQYPWRSSQRPDVNLCIGEWAGASGEEDSAAMLLRR